MTISVVTGANSGIGRATAIHLASRGHVVYGTVRSLDKVGKLLAMSAAAGVEVTRRSGLHGRMGHCTMSATSSFGMMLKEFDGGARQRM